MAPSDSRDSSIGLRKPCEVLHNLLIQSAAEIIEGAQSFRGSNYGYHVGFSLTTKSTDKDAPVNHGSRAYIIDGLGLPGILSLVVVGDRLENIKYIDNDLDGGMQRTCCISTLTVPYHPPEVPQNVTSLAGYRYSRIRLIGTAIMTTGEVLALKTTNDHAIRIVMSKNPLDPEALGKQIVVTGLVVDDCDQISVGGKTKQKLVDCRWLRYQEN